MKIITFSDLHFEFGAPFRLPPESSANVLVLAGDLITFNDEAPLEELLKAWQKPVIYVTGNHEYYVNRPLHDEDRHFKKWLARNHPNVTFLQNTSTTIEGVHFFGGTMWTDFAGENLKAMETARRGINDYRLIHKSEFESITPQDTIGLHKDFVTELVAWFEKDLPGPRVVVSHHAPVLNPETQHINSPLMPAFNSLDMVPMIEKYRPALWIYGHTHECDDQIIGDTRIISNQRGYPLKSGGFEGRGFDENGLPVEIRTA